MTDILHRTPDVSTASFVLHALTAEDIAQDLRDVYGENAFNDTVENALAFKGVAIAHSMTAPNTFGEFKSAHAEYEAYLDSLSPEERAALEESKRNSSSESPMSIPLVEDPETVRNEKTLTPDQYVGLPEPPRKEQVRANPVKELWDESVEKDADKHPKEFSPEGVAMIVEAARQVAMHPKHEGDDLAALDFLAQTSDEPKARVSQFILEKARSHRRTRAVMTNLLLRIA